MNVHKVLGYKLGIAFVRKSLEDDDAKGGQWCAVPTREVTDGLKHWLGYFPECFLGWGWG